ncbi:uncharacterized protein LOC128745859 [Sabethes cyaneus]|uniref:uncharacterized protein LOC128745859 n=1 Tax=Sabethes cyaneus TaxID=53552 RepID=UPI00237E3C0B|nr:uncharacterized protein LOC128745859 [Sabethes cyaneus]
MASDVQSYTVTLEDLHSSIQRFWEVEEVEAVPQTCTEEEECEQHFQATHRRDTTGRYIVQLPLRNSVSELGDSRTIALRRFYATERRLSKDPDLRKQYTDFLTEYEALGHCKEVYEVNDTQDKLKWYLPHHAVLKPSNTTTKCRVVFDGSAKVSGCSLNDVLQVGAINQSDLQSILYRFPTRALHQLAIDEGTNYLLAADVIMENCYIDNALLGFDDFHIASTAREQLIHLLSAGGFHLHKWSSNSLKLLETIPGADREELVTIGTDEVIKTLGLMCNPADDELIFISLSSVNMQIPTKRQVLSLIAWMYDPLGLVAPIIVIGKLLMQRIWKENWEWDETITGEIRTELEYFVQAISGVNQIHIPRQAVVTNAATFELHGFADASMYAYGACVFVRSVVPGTEVVMRLLCAKSKIVPKNVLTIPRKELLAARLLHHLVKKILSALTTAFEEIVLWSDSQIVLAWLQKTPSRLDVFVANRVNEIIASGERFRWRYVSTNHNPADVVSRGQPADKLARNDLWYTVIEIEILSLFTKYESFRKLQRVLAYVLRFCRNCKESVKENRVLEQFPTVFELRSAMNTIVRVTQHQSLDDEIMRLKAGKPCKRIWNLCPILDDGLLRVGGRLRNSNLPFESKHQLILPNSNRTVESFIMTIHQENLHAGPSALMAITRRQFWILKARSTFRKVTRSCVKCFKLKPVMAHQFMGDLPASRCDRAPAFQKVGVDFAGPILVKQTGRKAAPVKGYICLFVCLVTKGLHLEAVENLSSETFIAALVRFVSRGGIPEDLFSDNWTHFVGAKHELHELYKLFEQQLTKRQLFDFCHPRQIRWRMIHGRALGGWS